MRRRGFALAMVVLLGAVVVIVSGVMLERHASSRINVRRELDGYRAHHAGRGLTEVTNAWLQTIRSSDVSDLIGEDGHAFDLIIDDGTVVTVSLSDAQGSILADVSALGESEQEDAAGILERLREVAPGVIPESYLRLHGPLRVSALTAPEPVLRAVVLHATDGEGAPDLVEDIISERQDEDFKDLSIAQAISRAGLSVQARTKLRRLLTAEPDLWAVRAEITPPGERRPTEAYLGIAQLETRGGIRGRSSGFSPWGPFLSWERVDVEPIR